MKNKKNRDPFKAREAEKYANPIASREFILDLLETASGPLTQKDIALRLELTEADQKEALRRRLNAMERDGQVISNRRGAYGKIDKMSLVRGIVQGHRDGYGFLISAEGAEDIYLSNRQMRKVFSGDEVLVRPGERDVRGRQEGAVVEVLTSNTKQLVGRFNDDRGFYFVRPDNTRITQDILLAKEDIGEAKEGQLVVVDIIQQPGRQQRPKGRITEVLGDHMAPGMEIDVAMRSHGIPNSWPEEVQTSISALAAEVAEKDKRHRADLREIPFVTIDGEDARDFDDAVYCEQKKSGGWRLFVAIADVSHYVQSESALDNEARARGTSVYFPDFVVPMLPEILSNGLCSLNPHVDRLCMVCEMTVSAAGRISGYKFYEGLMHSHARLTYTDVGRVIDEQNKPRSGIRKQYHDLLPQLDALHGLYLALRGQREIRGAIDFETTETRIVFDENRKIKEIRPVVRNEAHKVIEECMLAANVCTAKFLESLDIPTLFRVHESPREEKLENLQEYLKELGLGFTGTEVTAKDYREVLMQVADRPDAHIIQTVMLRSMNQAMYQPDNHGHFGLAYESYTHFTSPIRRYPDLMVHRAVRAAIRSTIVTNKVERQKGVRLRKFENIYTYSQGEVASIGEQSSLAERRADDATRDVVNWLKCEYLAQRVGETYDGIVSAVTGFGLFVELKDYYVEGLVHITALPQDYYRFDAAKHRLVGERSRKVFRLGDELQVQVARVDLDERKVDFELLQAKPRKRKKTIVSDKAKSLAEEYIQDKNEKHKSKTKKTPAKSKTKQKKAKAVKSKASARPKKRKSGKRK